jgi:hypothetical protein
MTTFDDCMAAIRSLLADADSNGIGAAERSVNEYVAATTPEDRKAALLSVQQALQSHRDEQASEAPLSIADAVNDYIEKLMRELE